jgi:hypothetical protein
MDDNQTGERSSRDTFLIIVLCLLVGVPAFVFLNILTFGLFILLLVSAGVIGVFAAFHYVLWGRSFDREVAADRREEEVRSALEDEGDS